MASPDLQRVADAVIRRAQRQGHVVPREVREELTRAGLSDGLWKAVLDLARGTLSFRRGRYYYPGAVSPRLEEEQNRQRAIDRAVRGLIRRHKATAARLERRRNDRIDWIQSVKVYTEEGRELTLLSRDLSTTGIRLLGTCRLLGQKVRVVLPGEGEGEPCGFRVRILWTCAVGDDLFENGGTFLERLPVSVHPGSGISPEGAQ